MAVRNLPMSKREAGRLGGLARLKKHGNPGTSLSRAKGGRNSLSAHRRLQTRFKRLRMVTLPRPSERLAEFLGIVMGDGHVDKYQTTITTSSETDILHAQYVYHLAKNLFNAPVRLSKRNAHNAMIVVISSKAVCDYLESQGIPKGNKILLGVRIPGWIVASRDYSSALARGLFDSDGCVFVDSRTINGKSYKNLGIAFSNREKGLLRFFYEHLRSVGLRPTQTSPFGVFLRRKQDIDKYFELIGSSNSKHLSRYRKFIAIKRTRRDVRVVEGASFEN